MSCRLSGLRATLFFGDAEIDHMPSVAIYRSSAQLVFTAASMVAAINAVLGGAGVALWHQRPCFGPAIDGQRAADTGCVTACQLHRSGSQSAADAGRDRGSFQ